MDSSSSKQLDSGTRTLVQHSPYRFEVWAGISETSIRVRGRVGGIDLGLGLELMRLSFAL